ncbi:hypothetical protein FOZ63_008834, partial [Perkinsus olseni]
AGDTSAPMIMESPQLSDSTPISHFHDDTREVSKLMEENAELRRQLSRLEEEVEELRAELDVKNRLLANADISRSDGDRTARNTPNSAGLANNSSYVRLAGFSTRLHGGYYFPFLFRIHRVSIPFSAMVQEITSFVGMEDVTTDLVRQILQATIKTDDEYEAKKAQEWADQIGLKVVAKLK